MDICVICCNKTTCLILEQSSSSLDAHLYAVDSLEEAALRCKEKAFSGCIIDPELPDGKGVDLFKWAEQNMGRQIPVVLLKNPVHENEAVVAIKRLQDLHYLSQTLLKQLKEEYRATIHEKVEHLTQVVDLLKQKMDAPTLNILKYDLLKIAGSADVYGYGHVAEVCKQFNGVIGQKLIDLQYSSADPSWNLEFNEYLKKVKDGFERE